MTHRSSWKRREREAARLFGCKCQRCSGSSGRDDCSTSDSTHERLYIETKLRARHAAQATFDAVAAPARREGKVPVLILASKGRPGLLVVVRPDDLPAVAAEYLAARDDAGQEAFVGRVRALNSLRTDGTPLDGPEGGGA